uniref:Uncharacterized protein n=1 Tax=Caenorhabditis japonica TaxID=281687 RepID=A0A8R1EE10_CAEJA
MADVVAAAAIAAAADGSESEETTDGVRAGGIIVIERENSTAARDQFEKYENVRMSNEETVGSVHSE